MTNHTEAQSIPASSAANWNPWNWPLYLRVLLGVMIGLTVGIHFGSREIVWGWTTANLGTLASFYIQILTTLATPLIFFAIVEAFVQTNISGRQGLKMLVICAGNVAVAFVIGLTILNVWQPGRQWQGTFAERAQQVVASGTDPKSPKLQELKDKAEQISLSPLEIFRSYIPKSIAQPFAENMLLTVSALALLIGAALRSLKHNASTELAQAIGVTESLIVVAYQILIRILAWIIQLAPFAICLAVAGVVGATGVEVFKLVGVFFLTVTAALGIHSLIYYPLTAWLIGGKSPRLFFREGAAAILTGFSINSSLATAPLTLEALRRMRVSESSARLSACVGTNFNNDGITLYEAIAALFVAQAAGMVLPTEQQIAILLAALAGSMGIAGIPNSGLIILALVLKAARLPEDVVNLAIPIFYSIDFILARFRSMTNVMGDLQVAILLDAGRKTES